MDIELGTA